MNRNAPAISIGALVLSLVLEVWIPPIAYGYDNTSVNGRITCTSGVLAGPTALATGTIKVVADGQGHLTSGNARYQGGPGASGISCTYALTSGTYTVQSDGSGQANTNWSLISQNSSPNCAATVSQGSISFSLTKATFSAATSRSRSESGNCSLAAAP
ncbi:MAG TPA: hypothetical protein VK302_03840 [Terriglobales bacterium]|nr:hypothetical protein [Terriglobales bacterium]